MMEQLSDALTELHNNDDATGSASSAPRARISPPASTCRSSSARPPRSATSRRAMSIVVRPQQALHASRSSPPCRASCFTIGIETDAGRRHRGRRRRQPLLPDGGQARHRAPGRRAFPLPDPRRLGQRDVSPDAVRRIRRRSAPTRSAWCRRSCRRPADRARDGDSRERITAQRAARHPGHQGSRAQVSSRAGEARGDRRDPDDPRARDEHRRRRRRHSIVRRAAAPPCSRADDANFRETRGARRSARRGAS